MRSLLPGIALLLAPFYATADIITLETGFVLEGKVVDPESDPVVVELPKGKIEIFQDMIRSIEFGAIEAPEDDLEATASPEAEEEATTPEPVINLRPAIENDEDLTRYFNEVAAELDRILARPEEAAPGEEDLEPIYVKALGDLGPRAGALIRERLATASPFLGEALLDALHQAAPEEAREAAREVIVTHEHPKARARAVGVIGATQGSERDSLLEKAAQDSVWYVRSAAYREMAKAEEPGALDKVAAGLADEDEDVRAEVRALLKQKTGEDFNNLEDWAARNSAQTSEATKAAQ